ncbi:MFS transporter [Pseudarthrobacter sp. H2]|uniref:MFS transporter n=1 Tax=Pseudarthrobacter sp. H2 TaxID=3418415 RepID=UPI003CFA6274
MTTQTSSSMSEGGWNLRWTASFVGMMFAIEALTMTYIMLGMAYPLMAAEFQTDQIAWVFTASLLSGGAFSPLVGKLADAHGKKKLFVLVTAIALVGFIISAISTSFGVFILGRVLAGPLLATVFLTFSLMRDVFPGRTLKLGASLSNAGTGFFAIPVPFLAAYLLSTTMGFRSMLWVLAGMALISIVLVMVCIPESIVRTPSKIDLVGAVLTVAWFTAILLGISFGNTWGWSSPGILVLFGAGAGIFVLWVIYSLKKSEPFINVRFVKSGSMLGICIYNAFAIAGVSIINIILPMVVLMDPAAGMGYGLGMPAEGLAAFFGPQALAAIFTAVVVGKLSRKIRPAYLALAGCAVIAVGLFGAALFHYSFGALLFWLIIEGIGQGAALACMPLLVLEAVPIRLQAQMASLVLVAGCLLTAAAPLITTALMASGLVVTPPTAEAPNGGYMYTDEAITNAFLFISFLAAAGCGVVAATLLKRRDAERAAAMQSELEILGVVKTQGVEDGREPAAVS